jgi:hypothetical protein
MSNGGKSGKGGGLLLKRIGAGGVALLQTGYAFLVIRNQLIAGFDLFGFSLGSCAAVSGVFFWWIAFGVSSIKNQKRIRRTLFCGAILGLLGFIIGFFGPMIFTPESVVSVKFCKSGSVVRGFGEIKRFMGRVKGRGRSHLPFVD